MRKCILMYADQVREPKQRLTITVEPTLVEAGQLAVERGEADSMSAWVNDALADRVRLDQKRRLLAAAIADYELEFGEITPDEIETQRRSDRENATIVRGATTHGAAPLA